MNNSKKADIFDELLVLSSLFEKPQTKERLKAYTEELSEFEYDSVIYGIKKAKLECKFFPSLAEIIELVKMPNGSVDELAVKISNQIIESISRFGPYQVKEVQEFLGDAWPIVERSGGWKSLCEISNNEVSSTRAQLRELAKAYLQGSKREAKGEVKLVAIPDTEKNKLVKLTY